MVFDLKAMLADAPERETLVERHINAKFVRVLRLLGYDRRYVRGQGPYLFDDQGKQYLDCLSGYATFACGRNHPVIRDAIRQAMDLDLPNLLAMGVPALSGLLARELLAVAPSGLENVFFTNTGAEGVETALKYARAATGKPRIVHCHRSFHGLTMGALSVNGNQPFREGFGKLLPDVSTIPFNDLESLERVLAAGDVAGFIVEPIQGEGVYVPDDDYLPEVQKLCRRHRAMFIVDEVQTGLGRTGRMFACEQAGIEPDILILAKALSGGYVPAGAVLSRRWIHDKVFSSLDRCVVHSSTFSENDLAMAAGLATLHVIKTERLIENADRLGTRLLEGLQRIGARHEMFLEVRGRGLMTGIEFRPPRSPLLSMGWKLLHALDAGLFCQVMLVPLLAEHHILAQVAGHNLDVIKLLPPLVISDPDVDHIVESFDRVMAAAHQFPGPVWEIGKRISAAALRRGA